ncbi:MAG TPA: alpha/beta hydrolase, partial [Acidimicrobiales bacterium]|nr:alpha/beta hydrolase [Acidimicrobiales bacterium]
MNPLPGSNCRVSGTSVSGARCQAPGVRLAAEPVRYFCVMVAIAAPRAEGRLIVRKGRQLGYAEFGPPDGRPVIWFHGTPGGRRQVPHAARVAAHRLNARIIGIERPGTGWSTPHLYDSIIDLTSDLELALDQLDIDRFSVVGLSGGGPYTLATARAMGDRVVSVGVLGGVAPTRGDEASEGGPIALAVRLAPILPWLREPLGALLGTMARTLRPVASAGFDL